MSQQFAGWQRTAAHWVVPVRLASKSCPLFGTPEITPHSFGFPITKKTLTHWCKINGRPWRWLGNWSTYKEKIRDLGFFSLKKIRLKEQEKSYCCLMGGHKGSWAQWQDKKQWPWVANRQSTFKYKELLFFLTKGAVKHWKRSPTEAVDSPSLETKEPDLGLSTLIELNLF